jgi:hypothetical protein
MSDRKFRTNKLQTFENLLQTRMDKANQLRNLTTKKAELFTKFKEISNN